VALMSAIRDNEVHGLVLVRVPPHTSHLDQAPAVSLAGAFDKA